MNEDARPGQAILSKMLERLYAALSSGPAMNCRPHRSRQRLDLRQIEKLGDDLSAQSVLAALLDSRGQAKIVAMHEEPAPLPEAPAEVAEPFEAAPPAGPVEGVAADPADAEATAAAAARAEKARAEAAARAEQQAERAREHAQALRSYKAQQSVLTRARSITADARSYLQDTGAHALYLGFPLLSVPPSRTAGADGRRQARVLAPLALVPLQLAVTAGARPAIALACSESGEERLISNPALCAWIARRTGQRYEEPEEPHDGEVPWEELAHILSYAVDALELPPGRGNDFGHESELMRVPATAELDEKGACIIPAAVVGLFPLAKQAIVNDMEALVGGELAAAGPLESFLSVDLTSLEEEAPAAEDPPGWEASKRRLLPAADEHFVARADPCQQGAVLGAREEPVLVVHGPPGTGKSQTITNIIGDHLALGQRVLFVSDKRTALDVVKHRLDHLGLGELCAVVHDARRDRALLYRELKEQLGELADLEVPEPQRKLKRAAGEIDRNQEELESYLQGLEECSLEGLGSFADLVGAWFEIRDAEPPGAGAAALGKVIYEDALGMEADLREALQRGLAVTYAENPWVDAAGIGLRDYMRRPVEEVRAALDSLVATAQAAAATLPLEQPAFDSSPLFAQGEARTRLADRLQELVELAGDEGLRAWIDAGPEARDRAYTELSQLAAERDIFLAGTRDRELTLAVAGRPLALAEINQSLLALEDYRRIASAWHAFLHFGARNRARPTLDRLGLPLGAAAAEKASQFLTATRARILLSDLHRTHLSPGASAAAQPGELVDDDVLRRGLGAFGAVRQFLASLDSDIAQPELRAAVLEALPQEAARDALVSALRGAPEHARALAACEAAAEKCELFAPRFLVEQSGRGREGHEVVTVLESLRARLGDLEGVLQADAAIARLPAAAGAAAHSLLAAGRSPEDGWTTILATILRTEIDRRLAEHPELLSTDDERLLACQQRAGELQDRKRGLEREGILAQWRAIQRERLLVGTGSRLNSAGAELRRRLVSRGSRSTPLRRMIQMGSLTEGEDPLYSLRPVWLASPETVAQIFPRVPIFDTVVFDEASQVRLEEALPVLTRGLRVVIAGDPKQLPPTRFFEAALAESEDAGDADTDQGLFEQQQGEVEDLLTAALNMEVEHAHLDVHYRSENPGLIEFSNRHFYGSRLQPRPASPGAGSLWLPLRLQRVDGVYENRTNRAEAEAVTELVAELLSRGEPPSIGVACFNLTQRDLILDTLDTRAARDEEFAERLNVALERTGDDSFEGLFVKNLESVQGDERDHIIISTTYGPAPDGKFRKQFGPLTRAGGGRRMNVLVTRARQMIHLLTSIPAEAYRLEEELPSGKVPNGSWFLFAYLRFAEELARQHAADEAEQTPGGAEPEQRAVVRQRSTRHPCRLADSIARRLSAASGAPCEVYWGGDGFGIDVVMHDPTPGGAATVGVHLDATRFDRVPPPARWDGYRGAMLRGAGWRLERIWSPHFARDPDSYLARILAAHEAGLESSQPGAPPPER